MPAKVEANPSNPSNGTSEPVLGIDAVLSRAAPWFPEAVPLWPIPAWLPWVAPEASFWSVEGLGAFLFCAMSVPPLVEGGVTGCPYAGTLPGDAPAELPGFS